MKAESRKQKAESRKQKAEIVPMALNYVNVGRKLEIAICLQARDYKGFNTGSQLMNGVIVIE